MQFLALINFTIDPRFAKSTKEWTSKVPVKPLSKTEYQSGLEAMLGVGVQVYFVDKNIFRKIKNSEDHGYSILRTLKSENQKEGRNVCDY